MGTKKELVKKALIFSSSLDIIKQNEKKTLRKEQKMKNFLSCIYKALSFTSITFFTILMFFALFVFNTDTAHFTKEMLLNFAVFSAFVGVGALVFEIPRLPAVVSTLVHFVVSGVGYVVFLLMSLAITSTRIFVGVFVFVVAYFLIFAIIKLLRIPFREKEIQEE